MSPSGAGVKYLEHSTSSYRVLPNFKKKFIGRVWLLRLKLQSHKHFIYNSYLITVFNIFAHIVSDCK